MLSLQNSSSITFTRDQDKGIIFFETVPAGPGQGGTVPAPPAGQINLVLHSDMTWRMVSFTDIQGIGTAAARDVPASGNASASQVVLGSDTRLPAALAGPLTTQGAFPVTLTFTGATGVTFPTSGTLMANPMTAAGDIIFGGALGAPSRLPAGTNGQVLSLVSGVPTWVNSTSGGNVSTAGATSGQIAQFNGTTSIAGLATTGTGSAVLSASPALTGAPTAPTQTAGDNSTKLATTAYVATAVGAAAQVSGTPTAGQMAQWTSGTAIQGIGTTGTGNAVLAASPALTGSPTAPTQAANDNSTKLATTAYVATAVGAAAQISGTTPVAGQIAQWASGTAIQALGTTGSGNAVLAASPALTGTPTAPTATSGTNTTQLATTAFVAAAAAGFLTPGVLTNVFVNGTPGAFTWTPNAKTTKIFGILTGAGGGATTASTASNGAAAGGTTFFFMSVTGPISGVIGASAAGASNGGDSSFNTSIIANGGGSPLVRTGGSGSGGLFSIKGQNTLTLPSGITAGASSWWGSPDGGTTTQGAFGVGADGAAKSGANSSGGAGVILILEFA